MWKCPGPFKGKKIPRMEEEDFILMASPPTLPPLKLTSSPLLLHDLVNSENFPGECQNKCAVIFDNGMGLVQWLSYEELDNVAEFVKNELLTRRIGGGNNFIGVKCNVGILYPVLVLGILKSGSAFYNIDPDGIGQSVEDGVQYLGMEYVIASDKDKPWKGVDKVEEIVIPTNSGNSRVFRFKLFKSCGGRDSSIPVESQSRGAEQFAYAIQTSGTTGRKKSVLVPHSCICPNIEDFSRNLWNVTGKDVIFGAAPPTFDPHVVELFAALMAGASIFYTTPEVKQNPSLLANLLSLHQVTILQITPSLFRRLSGPLPQCECSVRLVTLGGETCPGKDELLKFQKGLSESGRNVVFQNVYGVTEVSCWASLETIDLDSTDPITIGQGLLETEVRLEPESNEIVIKSSTRKCIIIDSTKKSANCLKSGNLEYRTGDLGRLSKNGIVFLGRRDRVVKRNGMKVSLHHIEQMTISTGLVTFAQCTLYEGKIYLVARLKDEYSMEGRMMKGENLIGGKLELPLFMYPDHLIVLKDGTNIPLNSNGKVDLTSICSKFHHDILKNTRIPWNLSKDRHEIVETLTPIWKSCTTGGYRRPEQIEDIICQDNFTALGGTSVSAVRFIESVFMALKLFGSQIHQKWEQALFTSLLTGSFGEIVELIYKILQESGQSADLSPIPVEETFFTSDLLPDTQEKLLVLDNHFKELNIPDQFEFHLIQGENSRDSSLFTPVKEFSPFYLNTLKVSPNHTRSLQTHRFQLGLCVDASPVIVPQGTQQLVIIGCHGGVLLCIDLQTLQIVWKQRLPNRIEASVEIHPNSLFAYVGCHDGKLYKVSVLTGEILCWYDEADPSPIRSKNAYDDGNDVVIFVDSANSVYCVDAHSLNPIWTLGNIFRFLATASPVIWRGRCYLATLDKGIVCLNIRKRDGVIEWASRNDPEEDKSEVIYSTPVIYKSCRKTLLICGFTQGMEVREAKNGALLWRQICSNLTSVQAPIVNSCCGGNLIWIGNDRESSTRKGKILEVTSGKSLENFGVPFSCGSGAPVSSVVTEVTSGECFLVYKSSSEGCPQLTFVSLHDSQTREMIIEKIPDFETFSRPVCWNEFVLFGGRDNYLYVIRLLN